MMNINLIPDLMSVSTITDPSEVDFSQLYTFLSVSKENMTLICPMDYTPEHTILREDGWKGFKFADTLYTCNAGALSTISSVLDEAGIPIIMTSDVNMDYIFLKEEHFTKALYTLEQNGCKITNEMGDTTA